MKMIFPGSRSRIRAITLGLVCFFALVSCGGPRAPRAGSSGVGNGGDLMERFLEVTRLALNETLFLIRG
jgi:hypothetical protein